MDKKMRKTRIDEEAETEDNNEDNNNNNKSIYIAPNKSRLLSGALQNMAN